MKQPSLNSWILLMLQSLLTCVKLGVALECICTTDECVKVNRVLCTATNMCYVQKMTDVTSDVMDHKVIRGCIDESMPLLCENRRPEGYLGFWPVLHCCQEDWCNKDIIPTDPPWLLLQNNGEDLDLQADLDYPDNVGSKWQTKPQQNDKNQELSSQHNNNNTSNKVEFNILYIAVPLAGACVMLAIVIFSLYLLKVKRHVKHCNAKPQALPPNIYRQKLPLILTTDSKRTDVIYPTVTHNLVHHLSTSGKSGDVSSRDSGHLRQQPITCLLSHDPSESSAGSETKLLV